MSVDDCSMRRMGTGTPWQPGRLLLLGLALVTAFGVALLVGPSTELDSTLCAVGGPCAGVYARSLLGVVGMLAWGLAVIVVFPVAAVRWIRSKRSDQTGHPQ